LLYSETTSLISFKYSILNNIVKKLKLISLSVANKFIVLNNISAETLCNEITIIPEKVKKISIHRPHHMRPKNNIEFGHYLAGLIDGDGHFSSKQQLVIVFNVKDISLAYYIKQELEYGSIRKVKNKKAVILVIEKKKGIEKVIMLINKKIRTENKFNQINKNILSHSKYLEFNKTLDFELNLNNDLNNHWLAGFSDADASFQIKMLDRNNKIVEVRLNYQIDQKKQEILLLIKTFLGGNISYRKSQDTYYYGSTNFGSAKKVISYFDKFHMLSTKYINYLKWRKVYILIQYKEHLNSKGIDKIRKIKKSMNKCDDIVI